MNPAQDAADLMAAAHRELATQPAVTEYQRCLQCGAVAPRYVEEFSHPTTHKLVRTFACVDCGSWNVEQVTACGTCRAAEAVVDDDCVKCAVAFYVSNPAEFDPSESCWVSSHHWIEAANQIAPRIQHNQRAA